MAGAPFDEQGRAIPARIEGYGTVRPFAGAFAPAAAGGAGAGRDTAGASAPPRHKLLPNLRAAIEATGLQSGAVVSFHHHLRNGDQVLNQVLAECAALGIGDLTVAASSLFPVHAPLVGQIERGVVRGIHSAYITGPVAHAVSRGVLQTPVVMVTHGGRARALESGELVVDVAFIGAPTADACGNLNGVQGPSACGTLGYAMVDALHARQVVAVTDHLVPYPACPIEIAQDRVDFVVRIDSLGDPRGIVSGTTRATEDPTGLRIAQTAARVIEASGLLVDGFSFQTGAGGISLAVADAVRAAMQRRGVQGGFASGGITGYLVEMLEAGLFRSLLDVQCFDLKAVDSYRRNPAHQAMSAALYASPTRRGAVVDQLDAMILGAAEVDLDFNVNVSTGTDGRILGGSGGHADAAAGAKLAIVTTRLAAGMVPKIVERVGCRTTPGETIDVVVTEAGIAVNPRRGALVARLRDAGLKLVDIEALRAAAQNAIPVAAVGPGPAPEDRRIVAVVEYRDGSVIDVVRAIG